MRGELLPQPIPKREWRPRAKAADNIALIGTASRLQEKKKQIPPGVKGLKIDAAVFWGEEIQQEKRESFFNTKCFIGSENTCLFATSAFRKKGKNCVRNKTLCFSSIAR